MSCHGSYVSCLRRGARKSRLETDAQPNLLGREFERTCFKILSEENLTPQDLTHALKPVNVYSGVRDIEGPRQLTIER